MTVPTPTVPPSSQPAASTGGLDRGAHQPHREPGARDQPGHQPVARARAEAGTDVEHGGDRVEQHRAEHHRDPHRQRGRGWAARASDGVDGDGDDDDVGDGADAGPVTQRDPGQQHRRRRRPPRRPRWSSRCAGTAPGGTRPTGPVRGRRGPSGPSRSRSSASPTSSAAPRDQRRLMPWSGNRTRMASSSVRMRDDRRRRRRTRLPERGCGSPPTHSRSRARDPASGALSSSVDMSPIIGPNWLALSIASWCNTGIE